MITVNQERMKEINKSLVMNCYYHCGQISRIEISKITRLNKSTITNFTRDFQESGFIVPSGMGESGASGGRNTELFSVDKNALKYIGINFGKYTINVSLVNVKGEIVSSLEKPTGVNSEPQKMIDDADSLTGSLLRVQGLKIAQISGIGISISGLVDYAKGVVVCSPNLAWNNIKLKEYFEKKYNTAVFVDNNTRCIARGEMWFGNAKEFRSFLCINVAYGVGSAVVSDYKVLKDTKNYTSEIGHITMHENGPQCRCGKMGCLEMYAGGSAIAREAQRLLEGGEKSVLSGLAETNRENITAKTVAEAAEKGDPLSLKVMRNAAKKLGLALSYAVNLLDPDAIILSGGVSLAEGGFVEMIAKSMNRNTMFSRAEKCPLIRGRLGKNAEVIGAVTMVMESEGFMSERNFRDIINQIAEEERSESYD